MKQLIMHIHVGFFSARWNDSLACPHQWHPNNEVEGEGEGGVEYTLITVTNLYMNIYCYNYHIHLNSNAITLQVHDNIVADSRDMR